MACINFRPRKLAKRTRSGRAAVVAVNGLAPTPLLRLSCGAGTAGLAYAPLLRLETAFPARHRRHFGLIDPDEFEGRSAAGSARLSPARYDAVVAIDGLDQAAARETERLMRRRCNLVSAQQAPDWFWANGRQHRNRTRRRRFHRTVGDPRPGSLYRHDRCHGHPCRPTSPRPYRTGRRLRAGGPWTIQPSTGRVALRDFFGSGAACCTRSSRDR